MGASPQSLRHLSYTVPQLPQIVTFEGDWGVFQVHRNVVRMELWRRRLGEWLDCFEAVLEALEVQLEMTAPVVWISEWGTLEVHHNLLVGNRILPMMAHNLDILCFPLSLVLCFVSRWIGQVGRTGECLEMMAAKPGNFSLVVVVVDETHSWVPQTECLWSVSFLHYYLMIPHCPLGVGVSQTAHALKPYWLSWVEIRSSISYVNKRWWLTHYQFNWWFGTKRSIV